MNLKVAFGCVLLAATGACVAQSAGANDGLTGRWVVNADYLGSPLIYRLDLEEKAGKLTGRFGNPLQGTVNGPAVHFVATADDGSTDEVTATLKQGVMAGSVVHNDADDKSHPVHIGFTATKAPALVHGTPQRHEFTPTTFYREFSALNKPVLTVAPGDTIHTTTVDAGGADEKGVSRVLGGNPQTGPFYVQGALPGDTLVVHIVRLKLNRDYAISDDSIVTRGMNSDLAVKMKDAGKGVRWHIDTAKGVASVEKPGEHMTAYTVPLKPMLGCMATAPGASGAAPRTGDSGGWGGNMDFNEIVEGATVYLPVINPGALLYFGDAHAAQGDGELTGNALETSMDVEVTVDVLPGKRINSPRVESATHVMAMGLAGSLDEAFREATSNMAQWLSDDYKLTPSEVAEVLGSAAEYRISEVADRNAGVVLKLNKERLKTLTAAMK